MHVAFIPYGTRNAVEILFREMEAQKFKMPMTKGKKKSHIWLQGVIRQVPMGIYEYVFPKGGLNAVLTTLKFEHQDTGTYIASKTQIALLRKFLRLKKAPNFERKEKYLWRMFGVSIIPIGIREDGEIVGTKEDDLGWTHEAI